MALAGDGIRSVIEATTSDILTRAIIALSPVKKTGPAGNSKQWRLTLRLETELGKYHDCHGLALITSALRIIGRKSAVPHPTQSDPYALSFALAEADWLLLASKLYYRTFQ